MFTNNTEFKVGDIVRKKVRGRGTAKVVLINGSDIQIQTTARQKKAKASYGATPSHTTTYVPRGRERWVRADQYELAPQ